MTEYEVVINAWESIGKTPQGKIVIADLKESLLDHTFTDHTDLEMSAGAHNAMVELLGWLRGSTHE